jgi:hypothetical protein
MKFSVFSSLCSGFEEELGLGLRIQNILKLLRIKDSLHGIW